MVTTDDPALAARARELRDHGFSAERHFWHRSVAFNYRMGNLQAAVGVAQTERLAELVQARRRNAGRYTAALVESRASSFPPRPGRPNAYWMYASRAATGSALARRAPARLGAARDRDPQILRADPRRARLFPRHPGERYPVAEEPARTGLYLPSGPGLGEAEIDYVVRELARARG